jgi:hypothetical protein
MREGATEGRLAVQAFYDTARDALRAALDER